MFSHLTIGSTDIERSARFYDALFTAIGGKPAMRDDRNRLIYAHNGGVFLVGTPINGEPATHANGGTVGFTVDSAEQAHAWHDAGVAAGGTSVEDPPGRRDTPFGPLVLAYLRDPDGNKLCATHRVAE